MIRCAGGGVIDLGLLEASYRYIEMQRTVHIFYTILIVMVCGSIYIDVKASGTDGIKGLNWCFKWNT